MIIGILIGPITAKLYDEIAKDEGLNPKYLLQRLLVDRAKEGLPALSREKMAERVKLIEASNEERRATIKANRFQMGVNNRKTYQNIWQYRKRLQEKGLSEAQIHAMCLDRYGTDYAVKPSPNKNPRLNPNWKGGGRWRSS